MKVYGELTRWNDQRGFGFIMPAGGQSELFVHISAFPRDGRRPQINELISFEVETGADGRQRAVRVMRTQPRAPSARLRAPEAPDHRRSWVGGLVTLLMLGGIATYCYARLFNHAAAPRESTSSGVSCDGRRTCSQMRSCEEAKYFLRNCPGTKMDGNGDGIPCERQWCN